LRTRLIPLPHSSQTTSAALPADEHPIANDRVGRGSTLLRWRLSHFLNCGQRPVATPKED